jgi:RNA polymerase sigma-70 factor (ECF subfamily)
MDYAELSDEQLMERVVRGEVAAHEALYDRYGSAVMGLALRIIGDRAAAEEIVQETFWRVWRKANTYQAQRGNFTSWFFSIVRNLSIDVLRRQRLQRPIDKPEEYVEQIPDPSADVVEAAWLNGRRQKVQAAMATLPMEQRDVIERAYFNGMTHQEIARSTGEPLGTIHTRARLALQKLREALQIQEFDE